MRNIIMYTRAFVKYCNMILRFVPTFKVYTKREREKCIELKFFCAYSFGSNELKIGTRIGQRIHMNIK